MVSLLQNLADMDITYKALQVKLTFSLLFLLVVFKERLLRMLSEAGSSRGEKVCDSVFAGHGHRPPCEWPA
jgi:hypothetical protein